MDRLAATASSLREAVEVLRRHTAAGNGDGREVEVAADTAMAGRRAMTAVKELAGLLASEVRANAAVYRCDNPIVLV